MLQKVGDSMIDSVIGDNIPIFTEQEKFNETITSSVKRLEASLTGKSPFPLTLLCVLVLTVRPANLSMLAWCLAAVAMHSLSVA